ncbi:MAG: NAD-dependent epimerase/dehydratase family protein [Acidimicrobiales bacterium]
MLILVTGATGAVGRALALRLVAEGHEVLAATRHPDVYVGPGTAVAFDLDDPEAGADADVAAGLAAADAAYYLVHALGDADFAELDRRRVDRFAQVWGGDRPVVYLGGLGEPGTGSAHLRSRHEVGDRLAHRCATVVLRASVVISADSLSFQLMARLGRLAACSLLPVPLPTAALARTQPIALADLLAALVGALGMDPGTYDIGGPDVLTYQDLIVRSARAQGHRLVTLPVVPIDPVWIGPASALAAGTDPWATSALFAGMGTDAVVRPTHEPPGLSAATIGIDDAIATALQAT